MACRKLSLQFGLKRFFVVMFLLSLPLGWASLHLGATQRETALLAKLTASVGPIVEERRPVFRVT